MQIRNFTLLEFWRNQEQRPEGSPTRAGQTNYDDLYADVIFG